MLGLFKKKLPGCDALFKKFFSPWYAEDERPEMTRPDMYQIAAYKGKPLSFGDLQYLSPEYVKSRNQFINETMAQSALADFKHIYQADKIDLKLLDAIDKYYDRQKIAALIKTSDPADFSNDYLVTVCEFGVVLGCLFNELPGFDWLYAEPYFHSIIVNTETGYCITVFDWALKKFSEYGVDDGFVAKFHAVLEHLNDLPMA